MALNLSPRVIASVVAVDGGIARHNFVHDYSCGRIMRTASVLVPKRACLSAWSNPDGLHSKTSSSISTFRDRREATTSFFSLRPQFYVILLLLHSFCAHLILSFQSRASQPRLTRGCALILALKSLPPQSFLNTLLPLFNHGFVPEQDESPACSADFRCQAPCTHPAASFRALFLLTCAPTSVQETG